MEVAHFFCSAVASLAVHICVVFFFKQKTAYEMRISDWSSDVCSSDLVSLRGTAPNLTKTLVNGHAIATADWFILDQLDSTRSFNYLTLPAEIVGRIEVYKSPQADVEEGGVGGTINVHTRNPLDLDPFSLSASAQLVYADRADAVDRSEEHTSE